LKKSALFLETILCQGGAQRSLFVGFLLKSLRICAIKVDLKIYII